MYKKNLKKMNFFKTNLKEVLVTGSADEDVTRFLFRRIFESDDYARVQSEEPLIKNGHKITESCDLNRMAFDVNTFKPVCDDMKKNLCAIFCIENFNPRPETLLNDINILLSVFTAEELYNNLYFLCTFSSTVNDMNVFRNDFSQYDNILDYLNIPARERLAFAHGRVWVLHEKYIDDIKKIPVIREIIRPNPPRNLTIKVSLCLCLVFVYFLKKIGRCCLTAYACICDNICNRLFVRGLEYAFYFIGRSRG